MFDAHWRLELSLLSSDFLSDAWMSLSALYIEPTHESKKKRSLGSFSREEKGSSLSEGGLSRLLPRAFSRKIKRERRLHAADQLAREGPALFSSLEGISGSSVACFPSA